MDAHQNELPAVFRQVFEAGQAAIAQAQKDGQDLLPVVHEHRRQLKELAPSLVNQCLSQARELEAQLAALVNQCMLDRQAREMLLEQGPRAIREYQFAGELAQTLGYFNQRFLTATEERALRKTVREQGLVVEQALNGLLGHVINEVLFDSQERTAMRRTAQALRQLGALLEKPWDTGVLKADYTIRRRQFIRQTGLLCLRIYGHVTTDLMVGLLHFKQSHYLAGAEVEDDDELRLNVAINRELSKLPPLARKRSVKEQWATAAVVNAFLDRSHWKAWRLD